MIALRARVAEMARVAGVRAALLASEADGLAAASVAAVDVDADALAAFAMAVFHRTRTANSAAGYGDTRFVVIDAEQGRLFVAGTSDLALVVLTTREAGAGLVRVTMQRLLRELA
jgi:predicted regulator of Ras-like GTPase activity (Roadblock/LC7/MglB family)